MAQFLHVTVLIQITLVRIILPVLANLFVCPRASHPWSSSKKEMAELFSNSRSSIIDLGWLRATARAGPGSGRLRDLELHLCV